MALSRKEALDSASTQVRHILDKHICAGKITPECELHLAGLLADYIHSQSHDAEHALGAMKTIDMARKVLQSALNTKNLPF